MILKGISASTGIVTGRVINLEFNGTSHDIPCILVAKYFTPDIIMNFKSILGIVTENGGTTCHAAVLARTMSIPCVVGVNDVIKKIQTGQYVCLNAQELMGLGTVEVIE